MRDDDAPADDQGDVEGVMKLFGLIPCGHTLNQMVVDAIAAAEHA